MSFVEDGLLKEGNFEVVASGEVSRKPVFRHLATVQEIAALEPIDGADAIECAWILGWTVVVKKGEFKVGDYCAFFEIDSYLPVRPEFEFLRKNCFKSHPELGDGFRLKTVKLRGQLSQGLVLPLSEVLTDEVIKSIPPDPRLFHFGFGDDLTEILGVQKYEPPARGFGGIPRGNFPVFIRKTDQERIQNMTKYLKHIQDELFEVTLKLDGSSITVYNFEDRQGVCSRNFDLEEGETDLYWKTTRNISLLDAMAKLGRNLAVQGELMGPGVQKNRENLKEHNIYVFDIWDIDNQEYLTPENRALVLHDLWRFGARMTIAPIVENVMITGWDVKDFLAKANVSSIHHPIAEGLVFKSHRAGGISFKAINNAFLLKEKD